MTSALDISSALGELGDIEILIKFIVNTLSSDNSFNGFEVTDLYDVIPMLLIFDQKVKKVREYIDRPEIICT